MNDLESLIAGMRRAGATAIYAKSLAPNDNSKNQVYLGGSLEVLNLLPMGELSESSSESDVARVIVKAPLKFGWLLEDGRVAPAPGAQLILYPQYPEVRFSGFLKGSAGAPALLMSSRDPGRVLFLGVDPGGRLIGYVVAGGTEIAGEFQSRSHGSQPGTLVEVWRFVANSKDQLLAELRRIVGVQWIASKRLNGAGQIIECAGTNCGGYTLEAELGVRPSGSSAPDFLDWEVKQFAGGRGANVNGTITLMTPEPTGGVYIDGGLRQFLTKFGYPDQKVAGRRNFSSPHRMGRKNSRTGLDLTFLGTVRVDGGWSGAGAALALRAADGTIAAEWSMTKLLDHWRRKHERVVFVPSSSRLAAVREYKFGPRVRTCEGASFGGFIEALQTGTISYDPGIKGNAATGDFKKRNQLRVRFSNVNGLYKKSEDWVLT